jgi:SWIM zinc finger
MKIRVLSVDSMETLKGGIRKGSLNSAKGIFKDVNVEYITPKHIGFTLKDAVYNTSHSVIYFSEKDFKNAWNCDCKWFSVKNLFCKHILAVFLRLNNDENFLKKFEKEKL